MESLLFVILAIMKWAQANPAFLVPYPKRGPKLSGGIGGALADGWSSLRLISIVICVRWIMIGWHRGLGASVLGAVGLTLCV